MRKIKRKNEPGALQHLEPHIVIIYLLYDMDRNIYICPSRGQSQQQQQQ